MNATTRTTYTLSTDSATRTVAASSDDDAARKLAKAEAISGVKGVAGLLGRIKDRGGYATLTDDRGDIVGRIDPNQGTITIYPQG